MAQSLRKAWLAGLAVLGLVVGLLGGGGSPPGALGTHGDDPDVDFEAVYQACVGAATAAAGFEDTVGLNTEEQINCLGHYGITQGRTATTFAPRESVLRWQMALFMARAASAAGIVLENPAADQGFTDIGAVSEEARNAINGLAGAGIMPGASQTQFSPNSSVTRGSMANILDQFLSNARPGAGAFGQEDSYADVKADNTNVFTDLNTVPLATYNAVYRIYEAGVTQGIGDHMYGPERNVTRAQMAAFIMRALAHTVARPAGVSVQSAKDSVLGTESVQLLVSVRDAAFQPVVDAQVDVFKSTDPDEAFGDDGACDTGNVSKVGGVGSRACRVDSADEQTNVNGDLTELSVQVQDADVTLWAWTGDVNDDFDNDDTVAAQLSIGFSKAASQMLVTYDLGEGQTHSKFGETVTVTLQIADEDGKAVADKGQTVTVAHKTVNADGSETSGSSTYTTDADGKIVLEYTLADSNANAVGQDASVELTLTRAEGALPLQDEDGNPFMTETYRWSDAASAPRNLVLSTRNEFAMASDEGDGAQGAVTATLTDQFGNPVRGKGISFYSDTFCEPAEGETECTTTGIGAMGRGVTAMEDDGIRVLTGETRHRERTTRRNGEADFSYTYDSDASAIETIWATYELSAAEAIVVGCRDSDSDCDETDDERTLTSDRVYFYWVEEVDDVPFTGSILVKDLDNDQLVVASNEKLILVKYDANDQFNDLDGPGVFAGFEEDLGANADPSAGSVQVRRYESEAGKVSAFVLYQTWPAVDHPDGPAAGAAARFGQALAVDDGVMVVGASYETVGEDARAGRVYIYPDGPATAAGSIVKLQAPSPAAADYFGWDVDISGDTVVVGTARITGSAAGEKVYVYVRGSDGWPTDPTATFTSTVSGHDWGFGEGVAISGDGSTIAVVANGGNVTAVNGVVVYDKPSGGWVDDADSSDNILLKDTGPSLVPGTGASQGWGNGSGWDNERSVTISGDGSVIASGGCNAGRPTADDNYHCNGSVYVYVKNPSGAGWLDRNGVAQTNVTGATSRIIANPSGGNENGPNYLQTFGKYVALSEDGNTLVASGHYERASRRNGVAFVYVKPSGGWASRHYDNISDKAWGVELSVPTPQARTPDLLGQYIAINRDGSEVAASRHDRHEGDFLGSAVTFTRPDSGWANDDSMDAEYIGTFPNAHMGWATTYDKASGDLYTGIRNETKFPDVPSGKLLTVYQLTGS